MKNPNKTPRPQYPTPPPTPPEAWTGKLNKMSSATLKNLLRHLTFHGQGVSKRAWQIRERPSITLMVFMATFISYGAEPQPKCYDGNPTATANMAAQQNMFRSSAVVKPYQITTSSLQGAKPPTLGSAPAGSKTTVVASPSGTKVTTTFASGSTGTWNLSPGQGNGYVIIAPKPPSAQPKPAPVTQPKTCESPCNGIVTSYQPPVSTCQPKKTTCQEKQVTCQPKQECGKLKGVVTSYQPECKKHTNRSGGGDNTNPGGHGNSNGFQNPGVAKGVPTH